MNALGRAWRLLVVAIVFSIFGMAALLFTALFALCAPFLLRDERRRTVTRRLVRATFATVFWLLRLTRVCFLTVTPRAERAMLDHTPRVIIANHPTFLDVVALLSIVPKAACIAKSALLRNPFIGPIVRHAGYVTNESAEVLLTQGIETLEKGYPLIIFPEGTRSPRGGLNPFHRGAVTLAARAGCEILPLFITCDPPAFLKGTPWYKLPSSSFNLMIDLLEPLEFGSPSYGRFHEKVKEAGRPNHEKEISRELEERYQRHLWEEST